MAGNSFVSEHMCPVCGFLGLEEPAYTGGAPSYEICPSCGTEFGLHDYDQSFVKLRQRWIRGGCQFSFPDLQPPGWSAKQQLKRLTPSSD